MKPVIYALFTTFRGLVFLICKILSFLNVIGALSVLVIGAFAAGPFPWGAFLTFIIVAVAFQSLLIFYNRIVIWSSNGTVIVPE